MSFEKKEWKYRDTITADELNRMEGGIEEALSSGGSTGYECTEEYREFQKTTLTVNGATALNLNNVPDTLEVSIDGRSYSCQNVGDSGYYNYGDPEFVEYPFHIYRNPGGSYIEMSQDGTYDFTFGEIVEEITSTSCFKKAVTALFEIHNIYACGRSGEDISVSPGGKCRSLT